MTAGEDPVVTECYRCSSLVCSRSQIVNGTGPLDSQLLLVGEAPGEQEDTMGTPFVGRSGDILDEVLRDAGIQRERVRITNCVRCRPPDNRDPTDEELQNCYEYLVNEIMVSSPRIVVALGKVPSEKLLGRAVTVTKEIGTVVPWSIGDEEYPMMISAHPAATIYNPSLRGSLEEAFRAAGSWLDSGDQRTLSEY